MELLEDFISKISFLELVASCSNGFEATTVLQENKIDLIFTDIEMPDFSGIDIIKSLDQKPMVVFTTAYSHYAVEGFNLNAIDYLGNKEEPLRNVVDETIPKFIFVKSEYENLKVNLGEIKYVEGLKDYIKIYANSEKPILTLNSLKNFEEKLGQTDFIRVHKSFIVSLNHIHSVQRNRIVIDKKRIPIGLNYKDDFIKKIEG